MKKRYTVELTAQLKNGEKVTAYTTVEAENEESATKKLTETDPNIVVKEVKEKWVPRHLGLH